MSVTGPQGFRAAGVTAGLKAGGGLDLALVVNDGPEFAAAGLFTRNRFAAAPVLWSRQVLATGVVRAVLLNSGGANACTGRIGFADTHASAEAVGVALDVSAAEVAVASTGLIGERLDITALLAAVPDAASSLARDGGAAAARAIMTTDTVPKQALASAGPARVGGMAKGAGMLAPELATMLVVLTTDAAADPATLHRILLAASAQTFERLDADGCASTNDTVLLLASGAAGPVAESVLAPAVHQVCASLAGALLADAEGATKQVLIEVRGAACSADAEQVARALARSNLLKCALAGGDPNWGRVLAAVGTTSATFTPERVDVTMNGVLVARGGARAGDRATVDLSGPQVGIEVDLGAGTAQARLWTTDLTAGYVALNSEYPT